jgi:hypothetical protein
MTTPFQQANADVDQPLDPNLRKHYMQQQTTQTQVQQVSSIPQIPAELISLPSKGLIYPVGSPLANEESVEIKAMDAYCEDILTSRALIKNGTVINQLLKYCMLNKTIDPEEMLSGDRNAILIGLRVTGYGSEYETKITCNSCDKDFDNTFSLGALKVKGLGAKPLQPNTNLFNFRLPHSGAETHFKLFTAKDEAEIAKILEGKKKVGNQIDGSVTTKLFQSVVSINGETDRQKIAYAVKSMRASDARALRQHINDIEPEVDMKQKVMCPHCDTQSEVNMPLGSTFFWPDLGK